MNNITADEFSESFLSLYEVPKPNPAESSSAERSDDCVSSGPVDTRHLALMPNF